MINSNNSIDRLKALNPSINSIEDIRNIMHEFGTVGLIVITLPEGKTIIRARPNETNQSFSSISDLSYKPAEFNMTYQRASTPNTTMFYGCIVPDNISKEEFYDERVTPVIEASVMSI